MEGLIFNIQRFSIHDGPGIRTNVFFKGCPLRCAWCHNPEGLAARTELSFLVEKCVGCRACESVCPRGVHHFEQNAHEIRREACTACGACAGICPAGALEMLGKRWTVEQVVQAVERDRLFYLDGGGATLTGGEPLAQSAFALALARALRQRGISVCLETSGYAPAITLERIAPYINGFLFDVKETDPTRHRQYTGVELAPILENLRLLDQLGASITLRCPIIPGVNQRPEHFAALARLAKSLSHVEQIHLEPYHPMGIAKAARLGRTAAYQGTDFLDPRALEQPAQFLREQTGKSVWVL